jgi:hypothetical protein
MFCFRRKKSAKQKSAPMSVPIVQTYTQSKGEVSYENSTSPYSTKRRYHNVENSQYLLPNDEEGIVSQSGPLLAYARTLQGLTYI